MFKNYLDYIHDNPHGYWFKRKPFGWGWTPVKWQGWAVIVPYIVLVIFLGFGLKESSPKEIVTSFVLPIILLTAILILICYKKGEKPKWQWGWKR